MSLFVVKVEAWDATGNGDYYDVATLAHTERSARVLAARAVAKEGLTGAHSVQAKVVDPYRTGVVLIKREGMVR